jgi:hypothetical protein
MTKPKMYDYFHSKGIELKQDEIRHWIDKKVEKGNIRMFFVNTFLQDAQCLITVKGIFGISLNYAKLEISKGSSQFYIDIPKNRYPFTKSFEIILQKDNKIIWTKAVQKSGEFEKLI